MAEPVRELKFRATKKKKKTSNTDVQIQKFILPSRFFLVNVYNSTELLFLYVKLPSLLAYNMGKYDYPGSNIVPRTGRSRSTIQLISLDHINSYITTYNIEKIWVSGIQYHS